MKKYILIIINLFTFSLYSQNSETKLDIAKYNDFRILVPSPKQILTETPKSVLKLNYSIINSSETLKISDNNPNTLKIKYSSILPSSNTRKEE